MDYLALRQDNIEIKYVAGEKLWAKETSVFLQEALVFLSRYFGLKKPFSLIRVVLAPSRSQYDQLVANFLGIKAKTPSIPHWFMFLKSIYLPIWKRFLVGGGRVWLFIYRDRESMKMNFGSLF